MVPASLSKLAFWSRAHRWKKHAYDPARAPHRPLVTELVHAHLSPLTVRLRQGHVEDLITRVLEIETTPVPFEDEPAPRKLLLLIARTQQVIEQLETEQTALQRRFTRFSEMFSRVEDPEQQRYLITQYLINTITDERALKGDLKATRRFLGYDVLRERNTTELAHISVTIETCLELIGLACEACLTHEDQDHRPTLVELLQHTRAETFLSERMEQGDRWHARLAAAQALLRLYRSSAGQGAPSALIQAAADDDSAEAPAEARRQLRERHQAVLAAVERSARNQEEYPWVQARALETLLILGIDQARQVLYDRLFLDEPPLERTDFLFRRLAVELAGRYLRVLDATSLLTRLLERPDPSEHVRMGVCEALACLPPSAAISALTRVVGPDATVDEDSARVRAAAVRALRQVAVDGELDASSRETVVETFAAVIERDPDILVLEIACEEVPAVAEALGEDDRSALLNRWVPRWKAALMHAIGAESTPPRVCDVAAATAEVLERYGKPERHALTEHLRPIVADIKPGQRARVPWKTFPDDARRSGRDPVVLGRCLAELSTDDWGLCARIRKRSLVIWRGDIFRVRAWRLLHEFRNPAPNKRQGYVHSWGRTPRGEVRAPSGRLDEVTATTVPGERTHVDEAGGWGRYLPLADDVLDLPLLRARPVRIFSSHGVTELTPPSSLWKRLRNRAWITWKYPSVAAMRQSSLAATETGERHRFVQTLADKLDIDISFTPYAQLDHDEHVAGSKRILTLFRGKAAEAVQAGVQAAGAAAPAMVAPLDLFRDWMSQHGSYFMSLSENSQTALALFLTLFLSWFLISSHLRRRWLARAREGIPLSIGGWGTRGKSGTERLKAGLLHGLGYHVVAKTTGCEAMFINAQPGQEAIEIFLYRPYDKATIWEQADVLALAQGVDAQVFLWECMALNPRYVGILQHEWMQDDITTLTNAYPDHEDVQGPAGADVAKVIGTFIPWRSVCISSETNFLPLFAEISKERQTDFIPVEPWEGDLIAGDVLDLFPYSEHPRNISLVARMAEKLGLDREQSIILMAQNVVPDLGVLKAYGPACVRGRLLTFINGCSANERTGFLNNWRRTGLAALDADADPQSLVITVVNNRADRISRSKVFADILVGDVAVDRHVLIGTNLKGLHSYLNTALDLYLSERRIIQPTDFDEADPESLPMSRLSKEMKRFRIPAPSQKAALDRLALYAAGAHLSVHADAMAPVGRHLDELLAATPDQPIRVEEVLRGLDGHSGLKSALQELLSGAERSAGEWPETMEPPGPEDVITHFIEALAKMLVRARLEARLRQVVSSQSGIDSFHEAFDAAYRALFEKSLITVHDPATSGDRVVEICAGAIPPGTKVVVLGTQNIKGTGLDFVYRWIAIDKVKVMLEQVQSHRPEQRMAGLSALEGFEDYGLFGAGLARATLTDSSRYPALNAQEESLRERVVLKAEAIAKERRAALQSSGGGGPTVTFRVAGWLEGWVDYLDSIRRRRQSKQLMKDLTYQRISLARAAIEMRAIVSRQKGGWLAKSLAKKLSRKK